MIITSVRRLLSLEDSFKIAGTDCQTDHCSKAMHYMFYGLVVFFSRKETGEEFFVIQSDAEEELPWV